jgi:hypothetical protein
MQTARYANWVSLAESEMNGGNAFHHKCKKHWSYKSPSF